MQAGGGEGGAVSDSVSILARPSRRRAPSPGLITFLSYQFSVMSQDSSCSIEVPGCLN
jgi:hypothetical protein